MGLFHDNYMEDGMRYKLGYYPQHRRDLPYRLQELALTSPPADLFSLEPFTLDQIKGYLRVSHNKDDALIQGMISTGRAMVEKFCSRAIIRHQFRLWMDRTPYEVLELPYPPLVSVQAVKTTAPDGTATDVPSSSYFIQTDGEPGTIILNDSQLWPTNVRRHQCFNVDFTCGLPEATIRGTTPPAPALLEAIRQAVVVLYERRGDDMQAPQLPESAKALCMPFKQVRL